jgi:hypothetical protein
METAINKLLETMKAFEMQKEPLSEAEIADRLTALRNEIKDDELNNSFEMKAESMAFSFSIGNEENQDGWGSYFGPLCRFKNRTGEMVEFPSIQNVTDEILVYWSEKANKVKHPVMKMRYAGLVWDFSKLVIKKNPDPQMARIVIDSALATIEKKLYAHVVDMFKKLEWALSLSLSLNESGYQNKITDAIISFENSIAQDDKLNTWGFTYDILMTNKKISLSKRQKSKIISDLEERLDRITKMENPDPFGAEHGAMRLAEYYRKQNKFEQVKAVLTKYGNCFLNQSKRASPLLASAWMEKVHSVYRQFGLKEDVDFVLTFLQTIHKKTNEDLKKVSHEFTIPKDELDKIVSEILDGEFKLVFTRIAFEFILKKDEVEKQVKELSEEFVAHHLFTSVILSHDGRPTAQVGSIEDDLEGHIVMQMLKNMTFYSLILHHTLEGFIEKFSPSKNRFLNYLFESPVFEKNKKIIIEKAIGYYLENDFISFAHLIVPQIEAAFRNLVAISGGVIYKTGRSGGFNLKTFDEILRDSVIVNIFGKSISFYLRVLFTDQRGWNIRNSLCHGFLPPQQIDKNIADRMFHSLFLLGIVRNEEKNIKT